MLVWQSSGERRANTLHKAAGLAWVPPAPWRDTAIRGVCRGQPSRKAQLTLEYLMAILSALIIALGL